MSINIPNILTLVRILLTPLFVICLLRGMFGFALMVFTIAAVSDGLDGFLARVLHQRSELGAYLDPVADKLLLTAAFVTLAMLRHLPAWLTVVVVSRDILIAVGFLLFAMARKHVEIKPSITSKCTTAVQLITIILVLLNTSLPVFQSMLVAFYWAAAVLTIVSGLHYIYVGLNVMQDDTGDAPPR